MPEQQRIQANRATFNIRRAGTGPALILLHGWPEFSLAWEPVMQRLADRYTLIAPDLRGFGDSDKPDGPYGPDGHAADVFAIADALALDRFGLVGHDVGGPVMMAMARKHPERLAGLFLFDFVYPGIGPRLGTPDHLIEIWYQSFHQMPFAPLLVGASRDTCRAYIGHFLRHWAHRKDAHDDVLEAYVDNFLKPGNLEGGFAHYKASHPGRVAMMKGEAPQHPPITVPTCVRWGVGDPILLPEWSDRLGDTFADLDAAIFDGVGHFPHREDPDRTAAMIGDFFSQRDFGAEPG